MTNAAEDTQLAGEEPKNMPVKTNIRFLNRIQGVIRELQNINDFVEKMITNETNEKAGDSAFTEIVESRSFTIDRMNSREKRCLETNNNISLEDIETMEVQIQTLMDKLVEMQMRTAMQLMEERVRNQETTNKMEQQQELATKTNKTSTESELFQTAKTDFTNDGTNRDIAEKLRASLRKINELEMQQTTMMHKHDSKVELLNKKIEHYESERLASKRQIDDLSEVFSLKEATLEDLKETKIDGYELQIMKLEVARNQDKLELSDVRKQCKQLIEENTKLEEVRKSLETKNDWLVGQMSNLQQRLTADVEAQRVLMNKSKNELLERADKFRRQAEKEKAVSKVTKEMFVKLRAVQVAYKLKFQEASVNMKNLVAELMTFNVDLANVVRGWLHQLTTEVTKRVEPVWFEDDLSLEEFIDWAITAGVIISRYHLSIAFHIVANPETSKISSEKLRSMLSSNLEINSAFKVMLKNSGKVEFDVDSSKYPNWLRELLQSTQFFIELSLLLNNHKQYNQLNILFSRYVSENSIRTIAEFLKVEVDSLMSVVRGGNPHETIGSLSDDRFMRQSEQLYVGLARIILDGDTNVEEEVQVFKKNIPIILDPLKEMQHMIEELVSNLNFGGKYKTANIIKTIERQTQELLDKTSVLNLDFFGLGFVIVKRLKKVSELVTRLKLLDGEITASTWKQNELNLYDTSGYHLATESYKDLIYQLTSAKKSIGQFLSSANVLGKGSDQTKRYGVMTRDRQAAKSLSDVRTLSRMKSLQCDEAEIFRDVESRINALRKQLKSSPSHKRRDGHSNPSLSVEALSTNTAGLSDVKLISIEKNIERAIETLTTIKYQKHSASSNVK